jgi:hypothetical protein
MNILQVCHIIHHLKKKIIINDVEYIYDRIKKTRAVYDAALNNVTLDVFLENVKNNPET